MRTTSNSKTVKVRREGGGRPALYEHSIVCFSFVSCWTFLAFLLLASTSCFVILKNTSLTPRGSLHMSGGALSIDLSTVFKCSLLDLSL